MKKNDWIFTLIIAAIISASILLNNRYQLISEAYNSDVPATVLPMPVKTYLIDTLTGRVWNIGPKGWQLIEKQ